MCFNFIFLFLIHFGSKECILKTKLHTFLFSLFEYCIQFFFVETILLLALFASNIIYVCCVLNLLVLRHSVNFIQSGPGCSKHG